MSIVKKLFTLCFPKVRSDTASPQFKGPEHCMSLDKEEAYLLEAQSPLLRRLPYDREE